LRDAIDRIDAQLVELLNERARLAAEVGRLKGEVDSPVAGAHEREAEVITQGDLGFEGAAAGGGVGQCVPRDHVGMPRARAAR